MRRCRFPFAGDLNSRSGPDVLVAALSEALRPDPRFADLNEQPWGPDDVAWFPVGHHLIAKFMAEGRPFAIGPNVLFGHSQHPGAYGIEPQLLAYQNFAAVFTLSRWYSALQQKHFTQKSKHFILDYPLPQSWIPLANNKISERFVSSGMIFRKGGAAEQGIAVAIKMLLPANFHLTEIIYGRYSRSDLFYAAKCSPVCFYISSEDHYPLAAVEIGLMGCPIISDEKICSVVQHGITGIISAVRERGESDEFKWTDDAAERMIVEWKAATAMDRSAVREATIRKHDPALMRERVAAQLGLG